MAHRASAQFTSGYDRRTQTSTPDTVVPVRLTRKLAERINGVDLGGRRLGERLPLTAGEARLLIAEGWAEPVEATYRRRDDVPLDRFL